MTERKTLWCAPVPWETDGSGERGSISNPVITIAEAISLNADCVILFARMPSEDWKFIVGTS